MTNDFNEHEEHQDDFIDHDENGHDNGRKPGITGNLAEAWRTRPLFKFMVLIVAVFAVAVAAFSFFGSSNGGNEFARLGHPPSIKEAPGGAVSPYMREQTELANKARSEQAAASGGSALPTPIGQTTDAGQFGAPGSQNDPLNELRAETESLKKQVAQQQQAAAQQQVQQQQQQQRPQQFDNSLAEAMQNQMKQLLEGWTPKGMKSVTVIKAEDLVTQQKANEAAAASQQQAQQATQRILVVNAGTVSYAQLMTEANSDVPGPIMAQIVSGPLAGSRAIGSFQVAMGYEKYIVMKFAIADKKGKDYEINAIALDPDTTLGGMATEVDERYFTRVILPAAAGFLQGLGSGIGQANTTTISNGSSTFTSSTSNGFHQGIYTGLGQAAQTAGQFFQNEANLTKPLVRVASGTPIGLFFIQPVYEPTQNTVEAPGTAAASNAAAVAPAGANGLMGGSMTPNGFGPGGYPGTTVSGYGMNSGAQLQTSAGMPYPNYANPQASYNPYNRTNIGYPTGGYGGYNAAMPMGYAQ